MVSGPASRPASPSFLRSRRIRSRTSTGSALGEAALGRRERGSKAASPSTRCTAMSRLTQAWDRPSVRAASAWVRLCVVMAVMTSLALDPTAGSPGPATTSPRRVADRGNVTGPSGSPRCRCGEVTVHISLPGGRLWPGRSCARLCRGARRSRHAQVARTIQVRRAQASRPASSPDAFGWGAASAGSSSSPNCTASRPGASVRISGPSVRL